MKTKSKIWIVFLLLLSGKLWSQSSTIPYYSQHRLPCDSVVYHINFYNIAQDTGFTYYSDENVLHDTIMSFVNAIFNPACIYFKLCKVDSIADFNYYNLKDEDRLIEDTPLKRMYYNPYAINVYWTKSSYAVTYNGICKPFEEYPYIAVQSDPPSEKTFNPYNFARQLMYYFGMPHTSSTPTSKELVNGSNGEITADSIWDTPADPYYLVTSFPIELPLSRSYFYYNTIKDANGEYYVPMYDNFMAPYFVGRYSYGSVNNKLTKGQYQQLIRNERRCRHIRWQR